MFSSTNYRYEEYTRDTWGKILKVTAIDGETVRESVMKYDYFDRLIEQVETVNGALSVSNKYAYNAYGQRVLRETQTPLGPQTETREYDQFGRLTRIKSGTDEVVYEYNALNQVETQTVNGMEIAFTYTPHGQLQTKTLGGDVATLEYFYAPSGQLTGRSVNGEKVDYQYDARGQLLAVVNAAGETVESYTYDPAGNILGKTVDGVTTTFTYDAANQLVTSVKDGETTTFQYDAAGRLVKSGSTEYSYGWMDKVLSITENESVTREVSYYLNGQVAQVNDLSNQSVESFVWDGLALIQRNAVNYLNEPAVTGGNPVSADGKVLFNDLLGSSLGVIDSEGFEGIQRTAFGEVKKNTDFNFYTGKPEIEGLGYAFLFRNYQASIGKWLTTDPMGYPDGWNNLAYVNNGVTTAIDWLGRHIYDLIDREAVDGLGHATVIITYYDDTNGTYVAESFSYGGKSSGSAECDRWTSYGITEEGALKNALDAIDPNRSAYDALTGWQADNSASLDALRRVQDEVEQPYNGRSHNCLDISKAAREEAGIPVLEGDEFRPTHALDEYGARGGKELNHFLE